MKKIIVLILVIAAIVGIAFFVFRTSDTSLRGGLPEEKAIIKVTKEYLDDGFSKKGLYYQLTSSHGDGYDPNLAKKVVSELDIDWNEQAYRAANKYSETIEYYDKDTLKDDLIELGKFTEKQAEYGAEKYFR